MYLGLDDKAAFRGSLDVLCQTCRTVCTAAQGASMLAGFVPDEKVTCPTYLR